MSVWPRIKIKDLGKVVTGKTPSTKAPENFNGPYPFITIPDLDGQVYIRATERTISTRGADLLHSCLLPSNAVMMSCIATVGKCGIATKSSFTNQQINSVICNEKVEPRYLYYCFSQLKFQLEAAGGGGSVYTNVSKSRFSELEVPFPPSPEQRAIAAILGALDDKIELNHQMNQTLEAMAQVLFKNWFVDFEPFRDNGMQDSPLGEIPVGWRIGTIGDLAEVTSGKRPLDRMTHRTDDYSVPLYGGAGPMAWVQEQLYYEPLLITGRVGTLGVVNRTAKPCWPSDNTLVVLVKSSAAYPFLYYSMKRFDFDSLNRGSTQPLVTQTDLSNIELAFPSIEVLESFSNIVYPIFQLQDANEEQSRTLAALRDTLLPKLLSGEIRVKDAEEFVENIV